MSNQPDEDEGRGWDHSRGQWEFDHQGRITKRVGPKDNDPGEDDSGDDYE